MWVTVPSQCGQCVSQVHSATSMLFVVIPQVIYPLILECNPWKLPNKFWGFFVGGIRGCHKYTLFTSSKIRVKLIQLVLGLETCRTGILNLINLFFLKLYYWRGELFGTSVSIISIYFFWVFPKGLGWSKESFLSSSLNCCCSTVQLPPPFFFWFGSQFAIFWKMNPYTKGPH